jgi:hypothetical protein
MKRLCVISALFLLTLTVFYLHADTVGETWGFAQGKVVHKGTAKLAKKGKVQCLTFDLSALPKGAAVFHASLMCGVSGGGQPREPIRIHIIDKRDGKGNPVFGKDRLPLAPPYFRSFDVTKAVQKWVKDPKSNLGLAVLGFSDFDPAKTKLAIQYKGKAKNLPAQVEGLTALHHDGQTFLIFKEIPYFRPKKEEIFWVRKFEYKHFDTKPSTEPGEGFQGGPCLPAVYLTTYRHLHGVHIRDKPLPYKTQKWPPFKKFRDIPEVTYKAYRHTEKITSGNIKDAVFVGAVKPLTPYRHDMYVIHDKGEYYWPHEDPKSVIPTMMVSKDRAVIPGENFYVNTPTKGGSFFYAVTTVKEGVENLAQISAANSLQKPVEEKVETPKPVLQYIKQGYWKGNRGIPQLEHWHMFWIAPPLGNIPDNTPRRVIITIPSKYKAPGPVLVKTGPLNRFFGPRTINPSTLEVLMQQDVGYGGDLAYNNGRGTLISYRESKVDYYSERYVFALVDWAFKNWEVNKDFDHKWNPGSRTLESRLGPPDIVKTEQGDPGWNIYDITWYLARNPGKDIPFMSVVNSQPKDGNHGAEYGWHDDPKGWTALNKFRQPFIAGWSGGRPASSVTKGFASLDWTKTLPAFSNCSLNCNPGSGDPDDGDPFGQINGYLLWDSGDCVDEKDKWEMTVYLVPECPEQECTVDLTPRHRKQFNPKPGTKLKWENKDLKTGKAVSGDIEVDKWGLVTLKELVITKNKNRVKIWK